MSNTTRGRRNPWAAVAIPGFDRLDPVAKTPPALTRLGAGRDPRANRRRREQSKQRVFGSQCVRILTLGYLATPIRYARAVATDASRQARSAGVVEMMQVTISNRDYRQAWTKAADPEYEARLTDLGERLGGTPDEADLVWSGCCAWAYIHWNQYRSMKSDADRRELESTVASFYSRAPLSIVWQHDPLLRTMVDPEFITWVDAVLARPREA